MLTGSSFTLTPPAHAAATASAAPPAAKHDFSFHDFLDIINPLQHLPVVGTLYRAITGDEIKTPEKIAGDAIYGGPLGALSSVADAIYQQSTGKSFGDTVMGWLGFHHDARPTAVAQAVKPGAASETAQAAPDVSALTASLGRNGADADMTQRALYAYRRSFQTTTPSVFAAY